jgi:hypothetical protein
MPRFHRFSLACSIATAFSLALGGPESVLAQTPSISIDNVSVSEGSSGTKTATFTATLTPGTSPGTGICTAPIGLADVSQPTAVVGTGTPASCTEAALRAAVANGGVITFNCGSGPGDDQHHPDHEPAH